MPGKIVTSREWASVFPFSLVFSELVPEASSVCSTLSFKGVQYMKSKTSMLDCFVLLSVLNIVTAF